MTQGPGRWDRRQDQDPIAPAGTGDEPSSAATPSRPDTRIIRPMPAGTAGPSFETLAMQSALSRARDSSRFETPGADGSPGDARRRPSVRTLVVVAAATILLGVLGGAVWVGLQRDPAVDDQTIVKVSQSPGAEIRSPQDAVRGYLEALSTGDIEEALTFGPSPGAGSGVLLTQQAHAGMPESSWPSEIDVITQDPLATEVDVTYMLAGKPVSTTMRVTRDDAGSYALEQTTVEIQLEVAGGDNLPTLINGTVVDNRLAMRVVPGTYAPTTELSFLAFPESSLITISSLSYSDIPVYLVNPELTNEGTTALFEAARASLDRCLASTELQPAGCPNAIRAPKPVVPGSVQWTLQNRATLWQSVTPTLTAADQSVVVATVPLELRVTMDYTDGTSGSKDDPRSVSIRASMLGGEGSPVTVAWER